MHRIEVEESETLVSFLIPTRKRLDLLVRSIESIRSTCHKASNFEIIVIFDKDDQETQQDFQKLTFDFKVVTVVSERFGYYGLHQYINNAYQVSSGRWFWLSNDDLRMVGKNWDEVIKSYGSKLVVLNPKNTHPYWEKYCKDATISPVIPKKWFEILGRFSAYNQYDTYVNSVAYPLNMVINESRLCNSHEQVQDEVSAGISYERCPLPIHESELDQALLKQFLGSKILFKYWIERIPYRVAKYWRRRVRHFNRLLSFQYLQERISFSYFRKKIKKFLNGSR